MPVQTVNLASLNAQTVVTVDGNTLPSAGTVGIQISGNFTGTISFLGSVDGQNPFAVFATPLSASGGPQVTSTQAGGQWAVTVYGYSQLIVRMSSYTAGTAVVSTDVTAQGLPFPIANSLNFVVAGSNQGGPPASTGIGLNTGAPGSNVVAGIDPAENFQGGGSVRLGILRTNPGDTILTFTDNPWTAGLDLNNKILLSSGQGSPVEEVVIGANNTPSSTASVPLAVNLASPVVIGGTTLATFDTFQLNGPQNSPIGSATVVGQTTAIHMLVNPNPLDPTRPIIAAQSGRSNPGILGIVEQPDAVGSNDPAIQRRTLELILRELKIISAGIYQLKDSGGMETPSEFTDLGNPIQLN